MIMLKQIIHEAFQEIYQNTSPAANYETLLMIAKGDWFMEYYISEELFETILRKYIDHYQLSKPLSESFRCSMYLGPSPKFYPKNSPHGT